MQDAPTTFSLLQILQLTELPYLALCYLQAVLVLQEEPFFFICILFILIL